MDPVTVTAAATIAAGAYVLSSATKSAMQAPVEVLSPTFSDVTDSLAVKGDYFARTRRSWSNAAWSALPIPTTQDVDFFNAQIAEQPIIGRGVGGSPSPQPLQHSPSVWALASQQAAPIPPSWY